jgi:PPM family protein phosphatase
LNLFLVKSIPNVKNFNSGQIVANLIIHPLFSTGYFPMTVNLSPDSPILVIKENICFAIEDYRIEVESYLGCFTPGIHSFQVNIQSDRELDATDKRSALLRIGAIASGLDRELQLRTLLGEYGLISKSIVKERIEPKLARLELISQTVDTTDNLGDPSSEIQSSEPINSAANVTPSREDGEEHSDESIDVETNLNPDSADRIERSDSEVDTNLELETIAKIVDRSDLVTETENLESSPEIDLPEDIDPIASSDNEPTSQRTEIDRQDEFLAEEFFPEIVAGFDPAQAQIILITEFPSETHSLQRWLDGNPSQSEALSMAIQLCQCCSFLARKGWTIINLTPRFIEFNDRLKIYDLTHVYSLGETPAIGLIEEYYAPELTAGSPIDETMSTYMVGALLYQILHHQLPVFDRDFNLQIRPIPGLYQLLKISLSPAADDRFSLSQFQQLLIEARQDIDTPKIRWNIASSSTVGLSLSRLQNEDSFAIKQQRLSDKKHLVIGAVADGMGGMAQGEIASKIAIETVLGHPIPRELRSPEELNAWLVDLFEKANQSIADVVHDGGTTLSAIVAIDRVLTIGHVGDSRIYLIRHGKLQQLSEDHSFVGVLVNNGEITEEQSEARPDRNVLVKSLGSKTRLSNGYVQTLQKTIEQPSLTLENRDILLICSDGVWDLVKKSQLVGIFSASTDLQAAVDSTIQQAIDAGASDNATLLALQICLDYPASSGVN